MEKIAKIPQRGKDEYIPRAIIVLEEKVNEVVDAFNALVDLNEKLERQEIGLEKLATAVFELSTQLDDKALALKAYLDEQIKQFKEVKDGVSVL